jgi:type IV secretory pathway VirB10-like protein
MLSNRLAFAALAVACIAAAAGGSYFATRQNSASPLKTDETVVGVSKPAAAPVQESEAVVDESTRLPAEAPSGATPRPEPSTQKHTPASRPAAPSPAASAHSVTQSASSPAEPLPAQDHSLAGNTATAPQLPQGGIPLPASLPPPEAPPAPKLEERTAQEAPRPIEPPQKTFEELVVPTDSVIGLQSETSLTSERARVEDRVEARVTRDVRVHDAVAIPAGARAIGSVVTVDRGGKFKERARLGIRFNQLVLADGTRIPISTETIYRDGEPPGKESAAKLGGATVGGAILGAIFGGGKGAAIGATAGAGAGSAAVMAGDRNAASLRAGEPMTVRIVSPVSITVEQK